MRRHEYPNLSRLYRFPKSILISLFLDLRYLFSSIQFSFYHHCIYICATFVYSFLCILFIMLLLVTSSVEYAVLWCINYVRVNYFRILCWLTPKEKLGHHIVKENEEMLQYIILFISDSLIQSVYF